MANPTTNYGFVLPTSTDLVTDLPADFDVALQGVDTRLKALQPGTTLGDLAYSSATANTNTRLGIGSTSQVLTVAGGVPTWATPTAASGPAFAAYLSANQSVAGSTFTKIQINTEEFDTDNCYNNSSTYRFTPTTAGIYQVNFTLKDAGSDMIAAIYKNGTEFKRLWEFNVAGAGNSGGCLISFNGSTDYVEFYYLHYLGTANVTGGQSRTFASATWIRSN